MAGTTPWSGAARPVASSDEGSRLAQAFLFAMILAVAISPRFRFGFTPVALTVDFRIQDILIVLVLFYLVLSVKPETKSPLMSVFGWTLPAFFWLAALSTTIVAIDAPQISIFRRVAYLGRTIEIFVLAAVIAGLYLRSGDKARQTALGALYLGAVANFLWVLYQYLAGFNGTLLGSSVSELIQSYGPKLIGEASAFGTGQYFVFVASLGAAEVRAGVGRRFFGILLMGIGLFGATLAESRISMGVIAVIILLVFVLSNARKRIFNPGGIYIGILLVALFFVAFGTELGGRLSSEAITRGVNDRLEGIWKPLLSYVLDNPLTGIGPGGLTPDLPRTEAHNVILRALLDFGIPAGLAFLSLFVMVVVRSSAAAKLPGANDELRLFSNFAMLSTIGILVSGMVQDSLTAVTSSHLAMIAIALFSVAFARERDRSIRERDRRIEEDAGKSLAT